MSHRINTPKELADAREYFETKLAKREIGQTKYLEQMIILDEIEAGFLAK